MQQALCGLIKKLVNIITLGVNLLERDGISLFLRKVGLLQVTVPVLDLDERKEAVLLSSSETQSAKF